jgi:hypothetical protein
LFCTNLKASLRHSDKPSSTNPYSVPRLVSPAFIVAGHASLLLPQYSICDGENSFPFDPEAQFVGWQAAARPTFLVLFLPGCLQLFDCTAISAGLQILLQPMSALYQCNPHYLCKPFHHFAPFRIAALRNAWAQHGSL